MVGNGEGHHQAQNANGSLASGTNRTGLGQYCNVRVTYLMMNNQYATV
jgi:hypothetical protein